MARPLMLLRPENSDSENASNETDPGVFRLARLGDPGDGWS